MLLYDVFINQPSYSFVLNHPPPNQRRFLKVDVTLPELPYDKQNKLRSLLNRFNLTSTNVNKYTVKPVLKFK